MKVVKWVYVLLGFIALGLGILGIPLPILPTTPFLLLALYFFGKSSDRLHAWFLQTALYHNYLKSFDEQRALTAKSKAYILLLSTAMIAASFYFMPSIYGRIFIILLLLVEYWFFFFWIKTLPSTK
ncbi:YbaN family protein [Testudinibacter sp. P80/BLE/0925]|uniref:YbaN family protein n=1 Tax=Testudinibacter sp. TW-1 TaxID=3417757 RepID=UPI003D362DA0